MPTTRTTPTGAEHPNVRTMGRRAARRAAFAAWLEGAMAKAGVTNAQVAEATGVSLTSVSTWRRATNLPHLHHIPALCQVLGEPLAVGLHMAGKPPALDVRTRMTVDLDGSLPALLRRWRLEQGLTATEAGAMTGLGQTGWSRYENGHPVRSRKVLTRIADGTGLGAEAVAAAARVSPEVPGRFDPVAANLDDPLATLLRTRRAQLRLSEQTVAAAAGVGARTILRWEQGLGTAPTAGTLKVLAGVLNVSFTRMLTAAGTDPFLAGRIARCAGRTPTNTMALSQQLRDGRVALGMSQARLAARAGIPLRRVVGYEVGYWTPPLDRLVLLADILHLPLSNLIAASGLLAA